MDQPADPIIDRPADLIHWSLSRIEIRTAISGNKWPVARVELDHRTRGRVTDVATAPGAFEAVFKAASQILGINPELMSYTVCSCGREHQNSVRIRIEVEIGLGGKVYRGNSTGSDLVQCSLVAWLKAVEKGNSGADGSARVRARPFQVSALDENDDLWVFASSDHGAAEAINQEFREEGYSDIQFVA